MILKELKDGLLKQGSKFIEYKISKLMEAIDEIENGKIEFKKFIS